MTEKEILEGNRLIVKFLSLEENYLGVMHNRIYDKFSLEFLDYHRDWNLLFEVVEKIENLNGKASFSIHIISGFNPLKNELSDGVSHKVDIYEINLEDKERLIVHTYCENSRMIAIWKSCVEFIKWYNNRE